MRLHPILVSLFLLSSCAISDNSEFGYSDPLECGMNSQKLSKIDSLIDSGIEDGLFPGAVVSIVRGEKIVYNKAYGNRQIVPEIEPMSVETLFDLASLSKCIGTTPAIMQLIESGQITLTDPVSEYLPGFLPWTDSITGENVEITIQDLLTHSSGLDPEIVVSDYIEKYGSTVTDSLCSYISKDVGRNFKPKTDYLYSCVNFLTLQLILERVTSEKLCDYVDEHICQVLGMDNTSYNPDGEMLSNCAPTEVQDDGMPLLGVVHDPTARLINKGNSGNAGVFSNAYDLSLYAAAIMNGGEIDGKRILTQATVDRMVEVPSDNASHIGRALGWDKSSTSSKIKGAGLSDNTICHTGYTGTSMVIDLDSKVAIILLTNRVHPEDKGSLASIRAEISDIVASSIIE